MAAALELLAEAHERPREREEEEHEADEDEIHVFLRDQNQPVTPSVSVVCARAVEAFLE
jgi:hypothetical protein